MISETMTSRLHVLSADGVLVGQACNRGAGVVQIPHPAQIFTPSKHAHRTRTDSQASHLQPWACIAPPPSIPYTTTVPCSQRPSCGAGLALTGLADLSAPRGVFCDDGHVLVVDSANARVQVREANERLGVLAVHPPALHDPENRPLKLDHPEAILVHGLRHR